MNEALKALSDPIACTFLLTNLQNYVKLNSVRNENRGIIWQ